MFNVLLGSNYIYVNCCVAVTCPGHGFPARHVIHVNSPTWKSQNAVQQLDTAVVNVLKLADEKQIQVLAVPSISSGQSVDFDICCLLCHRHLLLNF